jgi:hypothetical protein
MNHFCISGEAPFDFAQGDRQTERSRSLFLPTKQKEIEKLNNLL